LQYEHPEVAVVLTVLHHLDIDDAKR